MLKAVWKKCVLRYRLNSDKVCKTQVVLSREFQTVGAYMEGTRTENKFHSRISKKINRRGTKCTNWLATSGSLRK